LASQEAGRLVQHGIEAIDVDDRPQCIGVTVGAYLIVVFVLLIATVLVRRRMLRGPVPPEPVPIDPYLAAHLAGGADRVALTVLAEMVDDDQLAVDRRGRVTVAPGDAVRDPMRVAVLRGFRGESRVGANGLYSRAARQPEMRAYADIAVRRGLCYEPASSSAPRRRPRRSGGRP
jgi:uncharacterized protein (TIGR04222 family)